MDELKESLVAAFCILSMVIAMAKVVVAEIEDLKRRWRK